MVVAYSAIVVIELGSCLIEATAVDVVLDIGAFVAVEFLQQWSHHQ